MVVVPIVTGESRRTRCQKQQNKSCRTYNIDHNRLRLCVNEVFTQVQLYQYHDNYAKCVSQKYGLSRGVRAEPGSKKKHMDSIEYNRMLAVQIQEKQQLIEALQSDYSEKLDADKKLQKRISVQSNQIEKNKAALEGQQGGFLNRVAAALAVESKEIRKKDLEIIKLKHEIFDLKLQLKAKQAVLEQIEALLSAMNTILSDFSKVKIADIEELQRLRAVELEYFELISSQELLSERLEQLEENKTTTTVDYCKHESTEAKHCNTDNQVRDLEPQIFDESDSTPQSN